MSMYPVSMLGVLHFWQLIVVRYAETEHTQ